MREKYSNYSRSSIQTLASYGQCKQNTFGRALKNVYCLVGLAIIPAQECLHRVPTKQRDVSTRGRLPKYLRPQV